ncbi:MAG: site-specific integrase [Thermoplasmatales archaeon]|nr:site-specific integrase [Thermoplasmatales archaeon]
MTITAPSKIKEEIDYKLFSNLKPAQKTINFFNNKSDSYSTNLNNELVGGKDQEWKNVLEKLGQNVKHPYPPMKGEVMGELEYIKTLNRFDCPIKLDPNTASFTDVGIHAVLRQRLQKSTVEKHLRYARFMENHHCPVNFRHPTLENFIRHMDYREQIENAGPHALIHEWKTMKIFLKAYGIPIWDYKPPSAPKSHKRILPFPETVYKFFHYKYSKDDYENTLYQYLFYHSFLIGWRVPSEICELKTSDIILNENNTGCIIITETKKHRSQRTLFPGKQLLYSKRHKSFKNWIDYWRPKVANKHSGDALYLQRDGKPLTVRALGHKLSRYGKKVWKPFQPYDMRHWCAVSRLIEQKVTTGIFDVIPVKNWLGHEKIQTTMNYIQYAEQYYKQAPYNWVKRVLKFHEKVEEENTLKPTNSQKTFVSHGNSPRESSGPGRN